MVKAFDMAHTIRINKYLPVAFLYFFFNGFLLPLGVLYTTLLTPLFIIWLYKFHYLKYTWPFFFILAPFTIAHFIFGVDVTYYAKSTLLLFSVYVFALTSYVFFQQQPLLSLYSLVNSYLLREDTAGLRVCRKGSAENNARTNACAC